MGGIGEKSEIGAISEISVIGEIGEIGVIGVINFMRKGITLITPITLIIHNKKTAPTRERSNMI